MGQYDFWLRFGLPAGIEVQERNREMNGIRYLKGQTGSQPAMHHKTNTEFKKHNILLLKVEKSNMGLMNHFHAP